LKSNLSINEKKKLLERKEGFLKNNEEGPPKITWKTPRKNPNKKNLFRGDRKPVPTASNQPPSHCFRLGAANPGHKKQPFWWAPTFFFMTGWVPPLVCFPPAGPPPLWFSPSFPPSTVCYGCLLFWFGLLAQATKPLSSPPRSRWKVEDGGLGGAGKNFGPGKKKEEVGR